ncbi:IS1096 element passenger TnpR family protein [Thiorhodovibrio frisius]|uniref:Plasmid pRiA4b ORF-3-like protein n=1 Tax=Thiorhodovibrio frisius TaxID=631362 RepID=H8Z8J5_9GAMM|nr:hypothetical protein [Thiorhodovibrio frisius]EIC19400.1 Plasmid pRiA4b ORF-3-like protein [Thiorhodovibrio frisius]WPL22298.1 Plasmid pRiA4b ORF-3-like protein [Thiorhodovibrio frisius]
MFITDRPIFTWNPSHAQVLESQDFAKQPPGTILRDFGALLDLIQPKGLAVTPKHLFAMNTLETINQRLTHPVDLQLKRPGQKSYPNINGLYLVLRATGLALIDTCGKKPILMLDPEILDLWSDLNPAEAYFALLRAWWGAADETIIDKRSREDVFAKSTRFLRQFKEQGPGWLQHPPVIDSLTYSPGLHNLALLELFGLLEIELVPPVEGQGWQPRQIHITAWGDALMAHFEHFLNELRTPAPDAPEPQLTISDLFEPSKRFETWAAGLRSKFNNWQRNLELPAPPLQPGQHIFRASLSPDCWRRIAIAGEAGFDQLASAILAAFDFDEDHLYAFNFQDRLGRPAEIGHPEMQAELDGKLADQVRVGELGLTKGASMVFVFDFGANWEFDLIVEQVRKEAAAKNPQVLEANGEAPPQYDDEDW